MNALTMCSNVSAATEATDTGDEDAVLMEKIHHKVAAEKAKMSISDKEELFKVRTRRWNPISLHYSYCTEMLISLAC